MCKCSESYMLFLSSSMQIQSCWMQFKRNTGRSKQLSHISNVPHWWESDGGDDNDSLQWSIRLSYVYHGTIPTGHCISGEPSCPTLPEPRDSSLERCSANLLLSAWNFRLRALLQRERSWRANKLHWCLLRGRLGCQKINVWSCLHLPRWSSVVGQSATAVHLLVDHRIRICGRLRSS
jgi:hypothetical protein